MVAGAVGGDLLIDAVADNHIEPVGQQTVDHAPRARRVIGRVAIDQHVDVGLDVSEHAPDHEALALAAFLEHLGAGGARHGDGIVA